jgi:hypothetical protein
MRNGSPTWVTGRHGRALRFDGNNNWVRVPRSASLDAPAATNALTLMAWVWLEPSASWMGFRNIASRQAQTGVWEHYSIVFNDRRPVGFLNSHQGGTAACYAPGLTPTGQWVHVAMTFDGAHLRVYQDGSQICTLARPVALGTDSTPLLIGANNNAAHEDPWELFAGLIDELVLYSRALSAAEIAAVAGGGAAPAQ